MGVLFLGKVRNYRKPTIKEAVRLADCYSLSDFEIVYEEEIHTLQMYKKKHIYNELEAEISVEIICMTLDLTLDEIMALSEEQRKLCFQEYVRFTHNEVENKELNIFFNRHLEEIQMMLRERGITNSGINLKTIVSTPYKKNG